MRKLDFTSPPLLATADWNFENERTITLRGRMEEVQSITLSYTFLESSPAPEESLK